MSSLTRLAAAEDGLVQAAYERVPSRRGRYRAVGELDAQQQEPPDR
jgi:hypothetical protein